VIEFGICSAGYLMPSLMRITAITRINERQVVMHTASDCSIKGCLFETINIKFPPLLIKGEGD